MGEGGRGEWEREWEGGRGSGERVGKVWEREWEGVGEGK